jgi:NAD(P)-dependent dehydrogenase (short-subunit alcohol dehydrogenase family)
MTSVWSYEGKRVIVSGGGGAGMGAATVRELDSLGAEIHVLDLKEPPLGVAGYHAVDLRDPAAIDAAVQAIGGQIDALFNCAGLPGGRFTDLDTMVVNFASMRHLTDLVVAHMEPGAAIASISSGAGAGWMANVGKWMPLVTCGGFEATVHWLEDHPEEIATGYAPSKEAIIVWTIWRSFELGKLGIRINCTSPGPTDTPMMPDFEEQVGKAFMDNYPIPLGRRSTPDEQAYPLIFLNSDAAVSITGENILTDGGTMGAMTVGTLDVSAFLLSELGGAEP